MTSETIPLSSTNPENGFYTGKEVSTGEIGFTGKSRRILHGLTIISPATAIACTIYGCVEVGSFMLALPFLTVLMWLFIHCALLLFAKNEQHYFQPPSWFIFISSGHIFMQSIIVSILTIYMKPT